jgi:hypothetical protein
MQAGEEPIPEAWAKAIEQSTSGEVRVADWPAVSAPSASDADPVPRFPTPVESDSLRNYQRLVDRRRRTTQQIGRKSRRNHHHPVYQWLDDIGRNLTWLADQIGSSRPSLQNYILGFRHLAGGGIKVSPVPSEIVQAVQRVSGGRVTAADWKRGTSAADADAPKKATG